MIIIADLHIKSVEPFYSSIKQFLEHLIKTYPDDEVQSLVEVFNTNISVGGE